MELLGIEQLACPGNASPKDRASELLRTPQCLSFLHQVEDGPTD